VVAAAGNEGLAVGTPANCSGVLAVGGLRHIGTKSGFANLGPEVALSAPAGNCVNEGANDPCLYGLLSTTNAGSTTPTTSTYTDAYNYGIGTSFATPIVAGTAALMLAANPDLTPATLRSLMRSSARAFPSSGSTSDVNACTAPSASAQLECYCTTSTCGAGMLDAQAAVQAAYNLNTQPVAEISASAATVRTGTSVTLSGAASFAGAGSSLSSHLWTLSSGSNLASFSGATDQASATLLTSAPGTVTVTLTVTNSAGSSDSATQTVLIQSPPTAVISLSDSTPVAGSGVTLIGSASAALGSATLSSYRWEITEGSTLAAFNGSSTNADSALTLSAAGTVTVKLTVTDSQGLSSSNTLSFTVAAAPAVVETGGGGGGGLGSLWAWALAGLAALVRRRQSGH
ncbi:S8 family serine peptidase, partial [Ideonella sp.]|uniref:S8 family serine peptidase n=1 Tax=Ideonella sp. TaxID=1929293 RepID=UPI003BB72453